MNREKEKNDESKFNGKELKDRELALVSELMRNSRRSDREIAKRLGVSQPTVSRMIQKLVKEGVIREYTMIPDFRRLGYNLCAFIFLKLRVPEPPKRIEDVRAAVKDSLDKSNYVFLLLERGLGLDRDAVIICLYKDYASYAEHRRIIREFPFIIATESDSFLIDLEDTLHYQYLTFTKVARDLHRRTNKNA
jgi:DNA-binding Lrp family transcriptional regulator